MRSIVRRHLGKVVAGTALAVTATAAMVAVTLPGDASGSDQAGSTGSGRSTADQNGQSAQAPAVVESAPPEGKKGQGRDPLTADETERAQSLALSRTVRDSGQDVARDKGPQPLTVDLAELAPDEVAAASAPRRADVSYYDYKHDAYVTKTVNLDSGRVEHTDTQHGVQPPPSRDEAREAARLLIADPLGKGLKQDYKDATGRELTGPDQLTVTGFVYRGAAEGTPPAGLADCGEHRCLRLFTKVENGPWIDTRQLVVDLSARGVGRLA